MSNEQDGSASGAPGRSSSGLAGDAAADTGGSSTEPGRDASQPVNATSSQGKQSIKPSRGVLRGVLLDPVFLVLVVASVALAVWGVMRAATSPDDQSFLTGFLLFGAALVPTAWAVLSVLWREEASIAIMVALLRTLVVPIIFCWPPAIAATVAIYLPSTQKLYNASQRDDGWRYFLGADGGSLVTQTLWLGGLAGMLFGILLGLALSVFVVLPILAWFKPIEAAKSNMMRTDTKEDRRAAPSGIRMLSVILMMTFGIPSFIIFGRAQSGSNSIIDSFANFPLAFSEPRYYFGDLLVVIGVLAIPFGVWLVIRLKRVQRPDLARRAQYGVNALDDRARYKKMLQEQEQEQEQESP